MPSSTFHLLSSSFIFALALLAQPARAELNMYVSDSDNNVIWSISESGTTNIFASANGNTINLPYGLAFDSAGNLYLANASGPTIQKFNPQGVGTNYGTLLGSGFPPEGIVFDSAGELLMASPNGNAILRLTNGTTTAGIFFDNAAAVLDGPSALAFDAAGNLYAANTGSSGFIQKAGSSGYIQKFAYPTTNNTRFASNLGTPYGLAFDTSGNLWAACGGGTIDRIDPLGNVAVVTNYGIVAVPSDLKFDVNSNCYIILNGVDEVVKLDPNTNTTVVVNMGHGHSLQYMALTYGAYSLDWFKAAGGGGTSTGGQFMVQDTVGQPEPGMWLGGKYGVVGGYWSLISTVPIPGAPLLSITLTHTNTAVVSWPSPSTGYILQQNSNLSSTNWVTAPETVSDNGITRSIIIGPPTNNVYYRLHN